MRLLVLSPARKELRSCHSVLTGQYLDTLKNQHFFLDSLEKWGHRKNHRAQNWRGRWQIQRVTTYRNRNPRAEISVESNGEVGKPELYLKDCWRLVWKSLWGKNSREDPILLRVLSLELYRVVTTRWRSKENPLGILAGGGWKEQFWNTPEHSAVLHKACPQEKLFYQRPNLWGFVRA